MSLLPSRLAFSNPEPGRERATITPWPRSEPAHPLLQLSAVIRIRGVDLGERIEAAISGAIETPDGCASAPIAACHSAEFRLGDAEPMAWIQLLDRGGVALTGEGFLGRCADASWRVHAEFAAPVSPPPEKRVVSIAVGGHAPDAASAPIRLGRGLVVRLVLRTYANSSGPRFQTGVLLIELMPAVDAEI